MTQFVLANNLTDAEIGELVAHDTVEIDGFLYREWRHDTEGEMWLRRVSGADLFATARDPMEFDDDDLDDDECVFYSEGSDDGE
jgi:hypothetical protein